jgi:fructokinase
MAIALIDNNGDATYEFNTPAAWDGLRMNEQLSTLINSEEGKTQSTIYIMGTIAGRLQSEKGATSASTLSAVRNNAPNGSVVLDVNLRSPWYDSDKVIALARGDSSSRKLALLKLNDEELVVLEDWCGLTSDTNELKGSVLRDRMKKLAGSLNTQRICVTRGANGAALWCESTDNNDIFHENTGYSLDTSGDSDTVGAGDAFLAGLVNSLFVLNELPGQALERACALGGYVAGCRGATPDHNDAPLELRQIFQHEVKRKQLAQ